MDLERQIDIEALGESFRECLKNSRILGGDRGEPTTFVMEDVLPDENTDRRYFESKVNLAQDKIWSIAPNGGALVIAHESNKVTVGDNTFHRCVSVYDGPGNLIKEIALNIQSPINKIHITPEECVLKVLSGHSALLQAVRGQPIRQRSPVTAE
jgi:hypothetical protein